MGNNFARKSNSNGEIIAYEIKKKKWIYRAIIQFSEYIYPPKQKPPKQKKRKREIEETLGTIIYYA